MMTLVVDMVMRMRTHTPCPFRTARCLRRPSLPIILSDSHSILLPIALAETGTAAAKRGTLRGAFPCQVSAAPTLSYPFH